MKNIDDNISRIHITTGTIVRTILIIICFAFIDMINLFFILRARHPDDNWSNHIGFPGGRRDEGDMDLIQTVTRETQEEVGFQVGSFEFIGPLNDLQARMGGSHLDFFIRPHVFHLADPAKPSLNTVEVEDAFWVPLNFLLEKSNHTVYRFEREKTEVSLPAITLPNKKILWGLSYLIFQDLVLKIFRTR